MRKEVSFALPSSISIKGTTFLAGKYLKFYFFVAIWKSHAIYRIKVTFTSQQTHKFHIHSKLTQIIPCIALTIRITIMFLVSVLFTFSDVVSIRVWSQLFPFYATEDIVFRPWHVHQIISSENQFKILNSLQKTTGNKWIVPSHSNITDLLKQEVVLGCVVVMTSPARHGVVVRWYWPTVSDPFCCRIKCYAIFFSI